MIKPSKEVVNSLDLDINNGILITYGVGTGNTTLPCSYTTEFTPISYGNNAGHTIHVNV